MGIRREGFTRFWWDGGGGCCGDMDTLSGADWSEDGVGWMRMDE